MKRIWGVNMASIRKIENKKGISYKISISMGYDMQGKKSVETTTYKPDSSLTLKQQEKAVEKFAIEFEDKIKNGKIFSGEKLAFEEFAEKWLESVKQDLAYGTYENYEALLKNRIIPHFKGYKLLK
jgi:hypothetical protein